MTGTKEGQAGGRRWLHGFRAAILAALALGAILSAAPVLAQTASPAQDAAPAAEPPRAAGALVAPPPVAPPQRAPAIGSEPAAPRGGESNPPPRITDALLPSALPRDLSPWGMFLSAVPIVKAVMVGLVFASLVTWTVWLAKTVELWNARRSARQGLQVLANAKSLRAAEKELGQVRSP